MTSLASDLAAVLATEAADRIARGLGSGFVRCAEEGHPLSEVQRIDLASAMLACFDGITASMAHTLSVDAVLRTGGYGDYLANRDPGDET